MTRYAPLWQQASSYAAALDRALISALWPAGGATGARPTVVTNQMQLNVPPGFCTVPLGNNGAALCRWDATEVVNFTAAATNPRIDVVVCTVRDNAIDAGANNDFIFQAVAGVPGASPVVPATPANSYALMNVLIPANAANLNTATLTDRRAPLGPGAGIHARVFRNGAFNLATGSPGAAVVFDTVDDDPSGLWRTNGTLVLPCAGRWDLRAQIAAAFSASGQAITARLRVNGTIVNQDARHGSFSWGGQTLVTYTYRAAAGDVIDAFGSNNAGALVGTTGSTNTWMSADYLGP